MIYTTVIISINILTIIIVTTTATTTTSSTNLINYYILESDYFDFFDFLLGSHYFDFCCSQTILNKITQV